MMSIRIKPLRRVLFTGLLLLGMALVASAGLVGQLVGRRDTGTLPRALQTVARLEGTRLETALANSHAQAGQVVDALLEATAAGRTGAGAVPWVPGGCTGMRPSRPMVGAGVFDETLGAPVMVLDFSSGNCVDALGAVSLAARTGPPFPPPRDVARLAQQALLGTSRASTQLQLVAVWRDGVKARWRLARGDGKRVAYVDLDPSRLPAGAALEGVRLDSFVQWDNIPVGYVHGGPDERALSGALEGVREGVTRALDLPDLAHLSASVAVLAYLQPHDADGGNFALGASSVEVASTPLKVTVTVLASAPWPLRENVAWQSLLVLGVLLALLWMILVETATRALAHKLLLTAQATREAWLGMRDDDVGSAEDLRRARTWLDAVAGLTQETLVAALGRAERFWAPAPMTRLLKLLRERLESPPRE